MESNPTHRSPAGLHGLRRALAPRHVTMISMGGIIGAGLFVGSSAAIAAVGPAITLSYLFAGALILLVMRMLAEMAGTMPGERSFVQFARHGLGPAAGFVVGWLYWYFWIIVVPVEAIAGAVLLQAWIPWPTWLLGLTLITVMTAVNLMSARTYGEFEFWFASIKVAAIIAFMALSAAHVARAPADALRHLTAFGGLAPHGPLAVLAGVTTVFFSLTGAEIATVAAAESLDPQRALTRMTTTVISRILLFYVGSVALIVAVIPWNSVVPGRSPFTQALLAIGYGWAGTAMSVVILTAVLSCLNSAFYVTSRVLFTLAGSGDAPQWLVQVNARGVPARSVMIGALAGVLGVLAAIWSPGGVFAFLVNASGALMLFVYLLTALAQIRSRRAAAAAGTPAPPLRMPWFPWSSYVAVGGMVAVLAAMAATRGLASQFYVSLGALTLAVLGYVLVARRRLPDTDTARAR